MFHFSLHLSSILTLSKIKHLFFQQTNEDLCRPDCWLFVLFHRQEKPPASMSYVWESDSFPLFGSFLLYPPCVLEILHFTKPAHTRLVVSPSSYAGCVQGPGMICSTGSFTIGTFTCDSSSRNGSPTKTRRCWDRTADHSFTPTGPSPSLSPKHTQYDENNYREPLYKKSQMFPSSSWSSSIQSKATI